MARNQEKQYGKLNRLILQKEKEERAEKHPPRPKLVNLHTVTEIKKWLPSIKRDIEFNLKQSQVTCYSDTKILELQAEVVRLEREYKSFVRKIRQVDGSITSVPWTNRPYERQKISTETINGVYELLEGPAFVPIATPILENEVKNVANTTVPLKTEETAKENTDASNKNGNISPSQVDKFNLPGQDEPLDFNTTFQSGLNSSVKNPKLEQNMEVSISRYEKYSAAVQATTNKLCEVFGIDERNWSDDEDSFVSNFKVTSKQDHVGGDEDCFVSDVKVASKQDHVGNNWTDIGSGALKNLTTREDNHTVQNVQTPTTLNKWVTDETVCLEKAGKGLLNLDYSSSDED